MLKAAQFTLMLLVLLAVAAIGRADTRVDRTTFYDVLISDAVAVGTGAENLVSVDLRVVNTTGDPGYTPRSFDGEYFGYTGITGTLHQQYSPIFSPTTPTPDAPLWSTAIDTHFLDVLADLLSVAPPSETVGVTPSAEPTDSPPPYDQLAETSFGDELTGLFGLLGGAASDTWQLAQIVAPYGTTVALYFSVSGILGGEGIDAGFQMRYRGDVDLDQDIDAADIDGLCASIGSPDPQFDLDLDGDVDADDQLYLVENLVALQDGSGRVGTKRGDFNLDGLVNATDLAIMQPTFGTWPRGWADGNANCDIFVDATDLAILAANFGFVAPTGAGQGAGVPEPASALFVLTGAAGVLRRRGGCAG